MRAVSRPVSYMPGGSLRAVQPVRCDGPHQWCNQVVSLLRYLLSRRTTHDLQ